MQKMQKIFQIIILFIFLVIPITTEAKNNYELAFQSMRCQAGFDILVRSEKQIISSSKIHREILKNQKEQLQLWKIRTFYILMEVHQKEIYEQFIFAEWLEK